ncbi:MAG: serine/threonine protein kinase [Myxococcales bacterium]|nr:serine/threonine protein kinase [Sorangiineae bacterium PRO1]MCL4750958.1 serine/threonine protein kinase [Myxococcales bacterium]
MQPKDADDGATLEELTMSEIELTRALDARESYASSPTATAPAVGKPQMQQVGRYELLLEIASGGMATVYVGRQRGAGGFERLVAIKRMHPHVGAEPELAASFMDEARIASLIRHPNVVNVQDVHDAEGEHLLVMDYVDGPSLANVMRAARKRNERISRPAAIRILVDALSGLHAAHEITNLDGIPLGVVHRDATPHNLLLGSDGTVRLTDFGIAKAAERSVHTATGMAKGKFRYMAPEQARGGAIDRRVDIFAMGIVAWELFTGERLFQADNDAQILLEVAEGKYRTPSSVDPTIPAELERIVMRALSPKPDDRWPTAAAFADALDGWARQHAELVSSAEIARLVHEFCGATIVERRKALAAVLGGTRQPAGFKSMRQTQSSGTGSTAGTSAPLTLDSVKVVPAVTREEIAEHQRRKRMTLVFLAAALGSVAVGLLIVFATLVTGRGRPATATPPSAAPSHTAAPPPATVVVPSARVRVVVTSDTEISEIRGPGVTGVQFKEKGAELELPRSSESVTLLVRLSDGSELSETITPNDNTAIRVRSVAGAVKPSDLPVAPGGKKPVGGKPAGGGGKPAGGGLEANPYE